RDPEIAQDVHPEAVLHEVDELRVKEEAGQRVEHRGDDIEQRRDEVGAQLLAEQCEEAHRLDGSSCGTTSRTYRSSRLIANGRSSRRPHPPLTTAAASAAAEGTPAAVLTKTPPPPPPSPSSSPRPTPTP